MRGSSLLWRAVCACLGLELVGCATHEEPPPLQIAVLMNIGPYELDLTPLDWAVETVNAAGGVAGGRKLKLVSFSGAEDLIKASRTVTGDPNIVAAVGPTASSQVMTVAPLFVQDEKVMLAPTSTSGEVVRAFYNTGLIWRTTESDIAQVETMLHVASERGVSRVALVTGFDAYGASFFDWFGFFAAELGLEVTDIVRFDQFSETCEDAMEQALASEPEMLFAVPVAVNRALCMARVFSERARGDTTLMMSDVAHDPLLVEELGAAVEGVEIITTASAPDGGFAEAFREHFGREPLNFAANMYDAILLLAYGLEYSEGRGGLALAVGIKRAVDGRGEQVGWDREGVRKALEAIRSGAEPDLQGATGTLSYDPSVYTDVTESFYGLWRIRDGDLVLERVYTTSESETRGARGVAASQARASSGLRQELEVGGRRYEPAQLTGLWAVIAAVSSGWENYRHQADALAQYRALKKSGVPDERILMIGADDLAAHADNALPGTVRYEVGGPNLYADVVYDYAPSQLSAEDLVDILRGRASERLPHVVESGEGDNVYVFLAGHGGRDGLVMDASSASEVERGVDDARLLTPQMLGAAFDAMFREGRYRRVLVAVEACHGGVLGTRVRAPGVLVLSAATPFENSLGRNYDPALRAWLADEFSFVLHQQMSSDSGASLWTLYEQLYHRVSGSHVSLYNARAFGDMRAVAVREFMEAPR